MDTAPVADLDPVEAPGPPEWGVHPQTDSTASERGLRGLVGGGSSQVSVGAAMRARDTARPTAEDLAQAEAELVVVRRHWTPRDQDGADPTGKGGAADQTGKSGAADQTGRAGSFGRVDS